ncbi:MAG TPA: (d)CMP kinase [Polyangiaceae bacterium LLY-WYZ-14_1]|nr:(d)CMP kinase [Polyangiaceae bacterium LLY-WYZ-14_1]
MTDGATHSSPERTAPVVAIDGPAGSGKSTAARLLAERLGFLLVDTGALYRAVALAARERGVDWQDGPALGALAGALTIELHPRPGARPRVTIDGVDRSAAVRSSEISTGASVVSQHPPVRAALLELQRALGRRGGVVLEGRDIGTVVFPEAEVKVFLTASAEVRARRRTEELAAQGNAAIYERVLAEVRERDHRDSSRPVAPLRPAEDAITMDTTGLELDAVVDELEALVRRRMTGANLG